ncbi:MAG: hypothetical protein MK101_04015 [Phycisphaerales bacterium]|nr:hypothetical protein [Phycisphaerales bacterium]
MSRSPIKQVNYPVFSDALYLDVPSEKSTIQDAVDAVDGPLPIIRLAAGEYEENIEIDGKSVTIVSESGELDVTIRPSNDAPIFTIKNTPEGEQVVLQAIMIIGELEDEGVTGDLQDGHGIRVVDATLALEGCCIVACRPGSGEGDDVRSGGALSATDSLVDCHRCLFSSCEARQGGAVAINNSNLSLSDCLICHNEAAFGGGLYADTSTVSVRRSILSGNEATGTGGSVWASSTTLKMHRCLIESSTAGMGGGGVTSGGSTTLAECQFTDVLATQEGFGDVWYEYSVQPVSLNGTWLCGSTNHVGCNLSNDLAYEYGCRLCLSDTNHDSEVDVIDLINVLLYWNTYDPFADLDGDQEVRLDDLIMVINSFGNCGLGDDGGGAVYK